MSTSFHSRIQRAWRAYLERKHNGQITQSKQADIFGCHGNSCQAAVIGIENSGKLSTENNLLKEKSNSDSTCTFNPMLENESFDDDLVTLATARQFTVTTKSLNSAQKNIDLSPQQQRKRTLLSQAHRFAELKKLNANVLPFNLHVHLQPRETTENDSLEREVRMSETMSPIEKQCNSKLIADLSGVSAPASLSNVNSNNLLTSETKLNSSGYNSGSEIICDKKGVNSTDTMEENQVTSKNSCDTKEDNCGDEGEGINAFEVYNIETALPDLDWKSLEEKLKAANEEARKIQEVSEY